MINFLKLYIQILRIRLIEEAIADQYQKQEMRCPVHLSIGQEAVAVGVCSELDPCDKIMSTHRAHAHYLAKGGSLQKMLAEIYGKKTGCCGGRGGSMHLLDLDVNMFGSTPIVGGSFPVAVGIAYAMKLKKENGIMTVFFGEAMTEEGVFVEAINFASLKELPVLFICESNEYSVYSPMKVRQPKTRSLQQIVKGHGIEASLGDGNNVEEVIALTKQAITKIKDNNKPQFIELETYRFREHCGPHYDIHLGYRSQKELDYWKRRCPVLNLKTKLLGNNLCSQAELIEIEDKIRQEINVAFEFAKNSPFPKKEDLTTHIYAK